MQELLLKRNHLFLLHFFTNYCESQRMHMIVFLWVPSSNLAPKNGICSEIFIGHSVCCWRTIYQTAPIITGNVKRPLGNTAVNFQMKLYVLQILGTFICIYEKTFQYQKRYQNTPPTVKRSFSAFCQNT